MIENADASTRHGPTRPTRPEAMSPMSWDDATQALPGMADLEGPQGASMSQDSVC